MKSEQQPTQSNVEAEEANSPFDYHHFVALLILQKEVNMQLAIEQMLDDELVAEVMQKLFGWRKNEAANRWEYGEMNAPTLHYGDLPRLDGNLMLKVWDAALDAGICVQVIDTSDFFGAVVYLTKIAAKAESIAQLPRAVCIVALMALEKKVK